MNKKIVKVIILCFCFMLIGFVAYSQKSPEPPKPPASKTNPSAPVGLPIDGGLSLLLISGVVYGVFELKRKK